ncbi:aldose epimerase family protein [cyanobacterium endosymbiont of Epithemia turgida]|uniref:aldose epimerase family protein n=1 Tax=cyanobacterium endosymbiont of Epithemia turgida TaxID=718217 RepID=UPI0004D0EF99|nr:aldose epimerase [cyanobacterium endosymbiont of Epithemia turgida]BAP18603.1 putative aldose 1-epimerase [cyanobacterium endosymbiont of Epithemia turgida isolate EtSB Lake Yunoko]
MAFSVTFKKEQYLTYILSDSEAISQITVVPERGGIILLWKIQGQDVLYLDKERFSKPEMSIRGGVPILFPICGNIHDNTYIYRDRTYTLKQHGFARDLPWEVTQQGTDNCASLTITLKSNKQTLLVYPFEFQLDFTYELKGNSLIIRQKYTNKSEKKMPFSFGFHPYYYIPDKSKVIFDIPSSEYQDQATKKIVSYDGTFNFDQDEIDVGFQSLTRSLATMTDNHRKLKLVLSWSDIYSTFVFWTLKGKDYVCLEPWTAPRNALNTGKKLTELDPGTTCEAMFEMSVESI